MVRRTATPISPLEYIQRSCELHLQARVANASSLEAIDRFLSGGLNSSASSSEGAGDDGGNRSGSGASCPRLFVWVPRPPSNSKSKVDGSNGDNEEEEWDEAIASTDSFDGRNLGSLAFVNASLVNSSGAAAAASVVADSSSDVSSIGGAAASGGTAAIKNARQIQCMVMSPRIYLDDDDDDDDGTAKEEDQQRPQQQQQQRQPLQRKHPPQHSKQHHPRRRRGQPHPDRNATGPPLPRLPPRFAEIVSRRRGHDARRGIGWGLRFLGGVGVESGVCQAGEVDVGEREGCRCLWRCRW
mmetsp:Transcript_3619/g.7732  ORF Transcript_3619/g.7732 Transcript_3619/m.7732 type:complete len:298 (+) Transcript_3619:244-1137(+)